MRKVLIIMVALALVAAGGSAVLAKNGKTKCTAITSGELVNSAGDTILPGYDQWGYNYQAHIFNGTYCDAYRDAAWCQAYKDVELIMKWNDAWLSNQDCDGDGALDRHYGYDSYIGSGAWITNHQTDTYELDGKKCRWTYFTKIVAAPDDAYLQDGVWYTAGGDEIGPVIWGQFATIQSVYNDPCAGVGGKEYGSPVGPGLGKW